MFAGNGICLSQLLRTRLMFARWDPDDAALAHNCLVEAGVYYYLHFLL